MRTLYVYILASQTRVLYTGVTRDLTRRMQLHRSPGRNSFTARYRVTKLVYYEAIAGPLQAIQREKQIKGWSRAKRLSLIAATNPLWQDLAADW
ncbi:MAG TPA: GIY-YIG nuclease family protein [Gemmatimonadales bacterium]|nr:GIY-YIG nuclease family protein [Gemmatimonadales bacterium]